MRDITRQELGERLTAAERHHHSGRTWGEEPARLLVIYPSPVTSDLVVQWVGLQDWSVAAGASGRQAPGATGDVEHDLGLLAAHPARLDPALSDHEFLVVGLLYEWAHEEAGELHDQRCLAAADRAGGLWHLVRDRGAPGFSPTAHLMVGDRGCVLASPLARAAEALAEAYPLHEGRQW